MINDSPVSLAGNFFSKNIKTKQDFPLRHCCLCEVPLYEISTLIPSSTSKLNNDNRYKELVCSKCTETYEKLIHLINNLQIQENNLSTWNNKEDNGDEIYEELESSFNSLSFHLKKSDQFQNCDIEPSFKKQCNSLEREIFENSQINNISNTNGLDKLYCDLKKIQDHNNYLLNKLKKPTAKRKNPLLRRIKQDVYNANNNANNNNNNNNNNNESATFKFNFNFNDNNNIFKNSPVSNNYNYQPHINFVPNGVINHNNDMNNNTLKSSNSTLSFNFIRDGMSTYASVDTKDIWSSLNNTAKDLWIKARRRFNYFRQTYNNNNNDNERDDMIKVSSGDDSEEEEYYRHAQ
ncbi:hypothetical protein PACTADRAFT_5185 [Pachysolen tannophilus NRRL Y-2460]|uniref:Uncharacterized protein n=1 Tax=Pachysolen tannophilus NRRL Y-2460 TaxID=669874 RepID=A0A1E4TNR7_PACTA|nr:hypothetical protein PACTADRAFT_5185 [Pachysolen tannophilus NRRL Y-2460]